MNGSRRSSRRRLALAFCLVVSSATAGDLFAGSSAPVTPESLQAFRSNFNLALDSYDAVLQRLGNTRGQNLISEARLRMQALTDDQLAAVFGRTGVPDLSEMVQTADALAAQTPSAPTGPLPLGPVPATPGFPGAPPILGVCNTIAHDSAFTFGALVASEVARGVLAAAEFVCEQVVVALGEGGNTSLACVAFSIAKEAAAIPFELASFCGGEEDSALLQGNFDRLDHIHTDLDNARSAIINNDNTNTTQIVNNDNANAALIVNNDNTNTIHIINNDNSNRDQIINNSNGNRDTIIAELRALACELDRLLNTPEGRRASSIQACQGQPGFPYSFPQK